MNSNIVKKTLLALMLFTFSATVFGQLAEVHKTTAIDKQKMHYNFIQYKHSVVSDDEQQMAIYISPFYTLNKLYNHTLLIYDKESENLTAKKLVLPEEHKLALGFDAGNNYFFSYIFSDKEYYYCPTQFAKNGSSTVKTPEKILLNSKRFPNTWELHSKNNKIHALIIEEAPKKNKEIPNYKIFIYDSLGNEVSRNDFKPYGIKDPLLDFESCSLTDNGEVAILYGGHDKKQKYLYAYYIALIGNDNNALEYRLPISSAALSAYSEPQLLPLGNGTYFIGRFTTNTSGKLGCHTMIFDSNSDELVKQNLSQLPEDCQKRNSGYLETIEACELDNGTIALLGEFQETIYGRNGVTMYCNDIVCPMINSEGECQEVQHIVKNQKSFANRVISPILVGLSYSVVQKGNDIYLIYTDNVKEGKQLTLSIGLGYMLNESCTRILKISPNGLESQVLFNGKEDDKIYTGNWNFDGKNIFLEMREVGNFLSIDGSYIRKITLLQ